MSVPLHSSQVPSENACCASSAPTHGCALPHERRGDGRDGHQLSHLSSPLFDLEADPKPMLWTL